jgi:hypothetical protein
MKNQSSGSVYSVDDIQKVDEGKVDTRLLRIITLVVYIHRIGEMDRVSFVPLLRFPALSLRTDLCRPTFSRTPTFNSTLLPTKLISSVREHGEVWKYGC